MGIFLKKKLDKTSEKNEIVCCSANEQFLFFPASLLLDFVAWDNVFVFIYLYFVSFTNNFQPTNKPDHFNPADRLNRPFSSRQISKPGHFPYSIPPDQAVFLSADLQFRPFPRSRPPVQTIFHETDLRPDHDQTTYLPAYQSATTLHRTPNFQTSRSDRFFMGWVKGG